MMTTGAQANWIFIKVFLLCIFLIAGHTTYAGLSSTSEQRQAQEILDSSGVKGGLIVHIGCGDGKLTAALRANDSYLVQGLDTKKQNVEKAREYIHTLNLYGRVSIDQLKGRRLPYINNLVNLVVSESLGAAAESEVMRILCPNGVAYIKRGGRWIKKVKSRPKELDDWTHYLHDASNNAVSHDTVVAPPSRMQWIGSPRYARHHDRMSSVSAAVTSGGRVFYIIDEAPRASILVPPEWSLIARDAFNGTILWKRMIPSWHTHLWPLKSGPAQLPRRLVAVGERVYATLGIDAPLTVLDAATGETIRTYEDTAGTEEVILSEDVLFLLVNKQAEKPEFANMKKISQGYKGVFWNKQPRQIMAISAGSGEVLWTAESRVLPVTLAADGRCVFFHDSRSVVCLDRKTGDELWSSEPVDWAGEILSFYAPILVVYKGVVLFSGGETAGLQTGSWYISGRDTMTALSAKNGEVLWTAYHPPSGYRSPEDLLVANGLVWTGETTSGRAEGVFTGRDPFTGVVKSEFEPDVELYWFHHRCYRGKATDNYLLMSRTGTEFIDVRKEKWIPHHWVRGACLYGVMPGNGMIYNPPHPCACYLESKLYGFNAVAPALSGPRIPKRVEKAARLEKGPAFDRNISTRSGEDQWPTYRHDEARSGSTNRAVPAALKRAWRVDIGEKLTSPVVAEGKVFAASVHAHTIYAVDADSGRRLWQYTAGGRVDSPPTIYQGRVLFGSADGYVYCVAARDGVLVWRFRAAPMDQRLMSFEQLESVWPVHGSVLIQNGVLYCLAGRSMFLDDGLHFWRLDPKTGEVLSHQVFNDLERETGKDIQSYVSWLNMPVAMPDILSSDGRLVYMRSQPFNLDGTRLPLKAMPAGADADRGAPPATQDGTQAHVFSPTGFLDDSGWHRTYWMYGSNFVSGWCGYYLAGKAAPAGKILVFDDSKVYGFGRKPQYYRWTTPIEHQLFAADKSMPELLSRRTGPSTANTGPSLIRVEKSNSLNPSGKPLTVEAWINSEQSNGTVLAHGGSNHGYALYLQNGQPRFIVRANGNLSSVRSKSKAVGQWVHLAGVLTGDKELRIYINGRLSASAKASGLLTANPAEAMEIANDEGSKVGDYGDPFGFKGLIDEVRIYHRALSEAEIKKHASARRRAAIDKPGLVLCYSFDKGNAADTSGNNNNGKIEGAAVTKGKIGRAFRFTGRASASASGFMVRHNWAQDVPLFARGMVLAGGTLFVAGPPDLLDEQEAFRRIGDPEIMQNLEVQSSCYKGEKGAILIAVSAADGKILTQYDLENPPVFDGLIAAGSRLYMATTNGHVLCMEGK
jgi:outer membrane protein assembly factor BamB